ncbi:MAG: chromosome segregation protein SMC [Candidatus Woesearchaeota archaeon]
MSYIEKIQIKGFKSFAKQIDLEFSNGFSAVIGSNGVGKSNIMDAFTFVLGKTSAKQMRAENAASLIFNGGKKGSPMREAEVAIFFTNKEKEFPLATNSVKISRVVKQSGNSIYKINDEKRTRQQAVDLLSKARINPDGFNIVLQGDIVLFTEMKPDERRVLIEDISGISVYEDKKHKAFLELEKVEQKLNDAALILKEREVHLRELKKERDQALKFKELESRIKESKATHLYLQIKDKEFKKDEIESKIKKRQSNISSTVKKIQEFREKIEQKKSELENTNNEIEEKGEVEQISLQKNTEALRERIIKDSARLETVTNEIFHIKQRISSLNTDEKEIHEKISSLEKELQELKTKSKTLEQEEKQTTSDIQNLRKKQDISSLEKLESRLDSFQNKFFKIKHEISSETIQKNQNSQELAHIEETLDKLSSPLLKKKFLELKKAEDFLSKLVDRSNVTTTLIEKNHQKTSQLKEELSTLQGTKIRIAQSLSGNQAISTILNSKTKGVFGTIAALGKVDNKYSTALEVTASGRINSIITDTDLTASDCIKTLKEKKAGIAMFLPLNKLQISSREKELEQLKNFTGVIDAAKNLIKYDKKFEKAFSYVFGSTLVIEDLQTARKVGIGRVRMVTLDGDLVEPSGAMIGGFRKRTLGIFEQKDIDLKISQKESEISTLKTDLTELLTHKQKEQLSIQTLSKDKAILEAEMTKLQHSSKIADLSKLKNKRTELSSLIKQSEKRIKSLQADEINLSREIERLKAERKPSEKQSKIEDFHEKHKQQRESLTQINTQIKNFQSQISSIHNPEIEKIQEIITQHNKEIKKFSEEEKSLKETSKLQQQKLKEAEKSEQKFRENYKALFNKRNKITEEIRKYESFISQEDFKQREVEKKMNEISLQRAKIVAELEALQQEYEPYIGTKLRRNISAEDLKREITDFERMLKNIGNVNLKALEVYEIILKEFEELNTKKGSLQKEKDDVLGMMTQIEGKKKRVFLKTYKEIAENFKRIFLTLSSKGDAYLELENKENPLDGGINIRVRLAGTKFLDLHSLSGGEKTLTALALIFAIQEYEPAPFYLLDEVDAALDKTNSQLLSNLVCQYAKSSQVVMISHNDHVITEADYIYGVSMQQNGISKITSLKL